MLIPTVDYALERGLFFEGGLRFFRVVPEIRPRGDLI